MPIGKVLSLGSKPVRCPLCHGSVPGHEFMEKFYDEQRRMSILVCRVDKIGIAANDLFVGKWDAAYDKLTPEEKMLCPQDDTVMRFFCTSTGYMKFKCPKPKCQMAIALAEPDRKDATGSNEGVGTKGLLS